MTTNVVIQVPLVAVTITTINNFEIIGECNDEKYQLSIVPVQNGVTYNWYDGGNNLIGTGSSIFISEEDSYEVHAELSTCSKIKSINIDDANCIIPKGISPNGDGKNDTWNLSNLNVEKAQIFNRYGMEMFSKSKYKNEWHGQSDQGHNLPSATYYFVLTLRNGKVKTGWVYLNREN